MKKIKKQPGGRSRRGASVVVVMGVLAVTLGLSYALIRSEISASRIQANAEQSLSARHAAATGMTIALRKMHDADWAGVNTQFSGIIDKNHRYEVSYRFGDDALSSGDAEYSELPFRVTLVAKGFAGDPSNPLLESQHQIRVVAQLVRRQLAAQSDSWQELQEYTVVQWADSKPEVQLPVRVEGPVRFADRLKLCDDYPDDDDALRRYFADMEAMRVAGLGDARPLTGPVHAEKGDLDSQTSSLLGDLGISSKELPKQKKHKDPINRPDTVETYRLYPGGPEYEIPRLYGWLKNVELGPEIEVNPLGVFRCRGWLYLDDNVTLRGTLLTDNRRSDIYIKGEGVRLEAIDLPSLSGATTPTQLPAAIVQDDFRVLDSSSGSIHGAVVVFDEFEIRRGSSDVKFGMQGRLFTAELELEGRSEWLAYKDRWGEFLDAFESQLEGTERPYKFFPQWLEAKFGLRSEPLLTIKPDSSAVTYHWHNWQDAVYVPHPDDEGLQWDLIRWEDNPKSWKDNEL